MQLQQLCNPVGYSLQPHCERWRHGPLARYVKLRVLHAPGMPGTFSSPPRVSDPDMHHGTCVTHVPWCMPGSLTSGLLCSRRRGKRPRHSRRMRNTQFYVSAKRPIGQRPVQDQTIWFAKSILSPQWKIRYWLWCIQSDEAEGQLILLAASVGNSTYVVHGTSSAWEYTPSDFEKHIGSQPSQFSWPLFILVAQYISCAAWCRHDINRFPHCWPFVRGILCDSSH